MSNLYDTFSNIVVFAYIGLLFWLYFRPAALDEDEPDDS
jgi:hypothetical protein